MTCERRAAARAAFAEAGVPVAEITKEEFAMLRRILDRTMKASGACRGSLCAPWGAATRVSDEGRIIAIRCKAENMGPREAVAFYPDGHIGLASWANDRDLTPVLAAFAAWTAELVRRRTPSG